jgi:5'-3' exonuclease
VQAKVVPEILGHANIGITLDTYSHAIPSLQESAAETVAAPHVRRLVSNRWASGPHNGRNRSGDQRRGSETGGREITPLSAVAWHAAAMADRMTRLVVDSPSLFYRAFFAVPKSIKGPAGNSVNAVRGYLDMVSRVIVDRRPEAVANVFDADWRPQWRVDLYAGYKAKRAEDPPELPGQVPLLLQVLDAAGLPVAEAAGYEADDVIGTIAAAAGPEERLAVLTGDRDLFQVVRNPVVWVLYPLRGTSSLATMDGAGVRAKAGVPAERYVDLAILRGDPSDGLPGVPGIGEKTAAGLIADHPDLDALLAAAAEGRLSPKLNAALTASADYIEAMRKVAAVATDVDYRISSPHPPDRDRLAAVAAENAIEGPVERMLQALEQAGLADPA